MEYGSCGSAEQLMRRALRLARRGRGRVEPNPMVGAVLVRAGEVVGEGWHERFGGPHAEVNAIAAAGARAQGATLFVTLEPCCHQGKTPPCTEAILRAGIVRVVAAMEDPFPQVANQGLARLMAAGLQVEVGLLRRQAQELNAPYLLRLATGRPWVTAKWAMTLDGKIATAAGESKWITGEAARAHAHEVRGRMDGILVGIGTVLADDPELTARPEGPRRACRIVLDRQLRLPLTSKLVRTARAVPVLVVHAHPAAPERRKALEAAGCECWAWPAGTATDLELFLRTLGQERQFTNLLVEGGATIMGSFAEGSLIDEVHAYVAPKLFGGMQAPGPVGGVGIAHVLNAMSLGRVRVRKLGADLLISGRVKRPGT